MAIVIPLGTGIANNSSYHHRSGINRGTIVHGSNNQDGNNHEGSKTGGVSREVTTGLVMLRECDDKSDVASTRSNCHKWLYSSLVSNAFAGGSAFMQQFFLKCLRWRLLNCIAVYCSLPFLELII